MAKAHNSQDGLAAPLWGRHPEVLHRVTHAVAGLVVTSAASFAVTAVGDDPLSVWMMAVLVLFSITLRGKQPLAGTGIVAAFFHGRS